MSSVTLSGVPVGPATAEDMRFVGLIWGQPGSGKSTLAATAPGTKLFLEFDNDGEMSLAGRNDVLVMQFYRLNPITVVQTFKGTDPYGLTKFLTDRPEIQTVVFDSMTMFAYMALMEAVQRAGGAKISMQQPGQQGYTYRNGTVLQAAHAMLSITAKLNRNLIFTTHEGAPVMNDDGSVESITMILSTNLASHIGLRINEVWHLADDNGKARVISVRPHTKMKPMKTRMFDAGNAAKFTWHDGQGIADWWQDYHDNHGAKVPLPSHARTVIGGVKK